MFPKTSRTPISSVSTGVDVGKMGEGVSKEVNGQPSVRAAQRSTSLRMATLAPMGRLEIVGKGMIDDALACS